MNIFRYWWGQHRKLFDPAHGSGVAFFGIVIFTFAVGASFHRDFAPISAGSPIALWIGSILAAELFLSILLCLTALMMNWFSFIRQTDDRYSAQASKNLLAMLPIFILSIIIPVGATRLLPSVEWAAGAQAMLIAVLWIGSWTSDRSEQSRARTESQETISTDQAKANV